MITVHHLENSRSQRILWLLEELELEYRIKRYERNKKTMLAPPELTKVHPLGKSPVIVDKTDDSRHVIAETGAIIEYLIERHANGRLAPKPGTDDRLRYTYWLHYSEGTLAPLLVMKLIFSRLSKPPMPLPLRPVAGLIASGVMGRFINPRIGQCMDFMEAELNKSEWFAGDVFSAADVMLSFPLEGASARSGLDSYPNLAAFLEKIHARPAYQRALERGGPYELLS